MAFYDGVKTVSGSIAHTDDAAAKVPFVSVKCGIEHTLTGVSQVVATQTGENLFDKATVTDNTWIVVNDTATESAVGYRTSDYIPVKANTKYYVSTKSSNRSAYYDRNKNGIAYFSFSGGASFTCLYDGYIRITIKNDVDLDSFIVNEGNTAITYEPYKGTTYTANLGRTIYGGTADVVNGRGSDNCTRIQIKDRTWTITEVGSSFQVFTCNKINTKEANFNFQVEGYENAETYRNYLQDKQCGTYNTTNAMDRIVIRDDSYTTVEDFITAKGDNYIVYENTSPTSFTFDPVTPTPETVGNVNNVYCDTGDTEVTYHDNAHGFAEVTVNKLQGKNLASELLEWNETNRIISPVFLKAGTYTVSFTRSTTPSAIYIRKGDTIVLSGNAYAYKYNSNSFTFNADVDGYYYVQIYRSASSTTWEDAPITNPQLEMGSVQTEYEPYVAPISKTAYLHKVIYGGQADVVKGTCKPKNLLKLYLARTSNLGVNFSLTDEGLLHMEGTNTSSTASAFSGGNYSTYDDCPWKFPAGTYTASSIVSADLSKIGSVNLLIRTKSDNVQTVYMLKDASRTFTVNDDFGAWFWASVLKTETVNCDVGVQMEKGSAASDFAPYFDPFTFPPISMSTDEGENTLFANEGASAITYRKETE